MALPARLAALLLLVLAGPSPAGAEAPLPLLHPLFADHAVLQRAAPVPIWGWAEPGSHIEVHFAGQAVEAAAGADRRWQSRLAPLAMSVTAAPGLSAAQESYCWSEPQAAVPRGCK